MGKLVQLQRGIATVNLSPSGAVSQNTMRERRFNRPRSTDIGTHHMTLTPAPHGGTLHGSALTLIALTATLSGTLCAAITTTGDEPSPSAGTLDPTVVVSTRTPLSLERVSPSVSWIPAEGIEAWQDQTLTDTLRRQPGMILWDNGSIGSASSLSIRGNESNHNSYFIDGRRLNPGFGNDYDLGFLGSLNAGSVEIQRGPSSVQYGSSNIGGVIDTRLRSGLDLTEPEGSVFVEGGSNDFRQASFQSRLGNESIGFSLSTLALSTDNERPHDAFESASLSSRLDYRINDLLQLELVALGFDNEKELPGSALRPSPFDTQDTRNWLLSPGIRYLSDELSVHLFYSRSERRSDNFRITAGFDPMFVYVGDFPLLNHIETISDEINLQIDWSLPGNSLLTLGTVWRNDLIDNSNTSFNSLGPVTPYHESFQQLGLFAQLLWMLGEDTELRAGLRHDDYSDYDNEITGNLMLIHHFRDSGTSLFAKAATAYAPPSPVDLAYDSIPTTPLNAERSRSYELGVDQELIDDALSASVVVFHNEIDDLLSYEPLTFDTFNIEEATTQGIEAALRWQASEQWQLGLAYTYLRAVSDRLDDPRTAAFGDPAKDVPLARRPRHLVQFDATYEFHEDFLLGLQAVGQFKREDIDSATIVQGEAEDFVVLRLVGSWQITEDWTLTGRIENLLDESYSSSADYPALGRTVYVGAKMEF